MCDGFETYAERQYCCLPVSTTFSRQGFIDLRELLFVRQEKQQSHGKKRKADTVFFFPVSNGISAVSREVNPMMESRVGGGLCEAGGQAEILYKWVSNVSSNG